MEKSQVKERGKLKMESARENGLEGEKSTVRRTRTLGGVQGTIRERGWKIKVWQRKRRLKAVETKNCVA